MNIITHHSGVLKIYNRVFVHIEVYIYDTYDLNTVLLKHDQISVKGSGV